jgi:hypothetical protein
MVSYLLLLKYNSRLTTEGIVPNIDCTMSCVIAFIGNEASLLLSRIVSCRPCHNEGQDLSRPWRLPPDNRRQDDDDKPHDLETTPKAAGDPQLITLH